MSGGHLGAPTATGQLGINVPLQQAEGGSGLRALALQERGVVVVLEHKLPRCRAIESSSRIHPIHGPIHGLHGTIPPFLQYHEDMHKA